MSLSTSKCGKKLEKEEVTRWNCRMQESTLTWQYDIKHDEITMEYSIIKELGLMKLGGHLETGVNMAC